MCPNCRQTIEPQSPNFWNLADDNASEACHYCCRRRCGLPWLDQKYPWTYWWVADPNSKNHWAMTLMESEMLSASINSSIVKRFFFWKAVSSHQKGHDNNCFCQSSALYSHIFTTPSPLNLTCTYLSAQTIPSTLQQPCQHLNWEKCQSRCNFCSHRPSPFP